MSAHVITIAQQKGGAGKTTLALQLATALVEQGARVVCFDVDPQLSLTRWYEKRQKRYGDKVVAPEVRTVSGWRVSSELNRYRPDYDYIIVDTPPSLGTESRISIREADLVLAPVQPSPIVLWSTESFLETLEREGVPCRLVLNRVRQTRLSDTVKNQLRNMRVRLTRSSVGSRVSLALSVMHGMGVNEMMPEGKGAFEINQLAKEIPKILEFEREQQAA